MTEEERAAKLKSAVNTIEEALTEIINLEPWFDGNGEPTGDEGEHRIITDWVTVVAHTTASEFGTSRHYGVVASPMPHHAGVGMAHWLLKTLEESA